MEELNVHEHQPKTPFLSKTASYTIEVIEVPEYEVKLRVVVKTDWACLEDLYTELGRFNDANEGVIDVYVEEARIVQSL